MTTKIPVSFYNEKSLQDVFDRLTEKYTPEQKVLIHLLERTLSLMTLSVSMGETLSKLEERMQDQVTRCIDAMDSNLEHQVRIYSSLIKISEDDLLVLVTTIIISLQDVMRSQVYQEVLPQQDGKPTIH